MKLPPVRKRESYADIGKDDLVMALFHDKIAPTDAMKESTEDIGATDPNTKAIEDLERWERKAIKRFKATGRAAVGFESDAIDPDDHARISAALKAAQTVEAVKAAFRGDVDGLIAQHMDGAVEWAREAMDGGDA